MPPVANGRRTRRVVAAEVEDVDKAIDEVTPEDVEAVTRVLTAPARKPRARKAGTADLRRAQTATMDEKARVPRAKRAGENHKGELVAPIQGRYFKLSKSVGLMPLMEWAAAREDVDAQNAAQLLGFYRVLQDVVDPEDWPEFKQFCREAKCSDQDMIAFQNAAFEAIAAYPTQEPAAS